MSLLTTAIPALPPASAAAAAAPGEASVSRVAEEADVECVVRIFLASAAFVAAVVHPPALLPLDARPVHVRYIVTASSPRQSPAAAPWRQRVGWQFPKPAQLFAAHYPWPGRKTPTNPAADRAPRSRGIHGSGPYSWDPS